MRVHADRQTLILAGEPLPRRNAASTSPTTSVAGRGANSQRVTYISARIDAVVTDAEVTDAEYTPSATLPDTSIVAYDAGDVADVGSDAALPATLTGRSAVAARAYSSYASSSRGSIFGGASAYARTQALSERHPIIDTYA